MHMIDFHTHILHNIDDGNQSLDESLELLRECGKQGVTHVVMTPHFYPYMTNPETFLSKRDRAFIELKERIEKESASCGAEWPELIIGSEVYYFPELINMVDLKRLCIGNSKYLMIELLNENWNDNIYFIFERLIVNKGIIPVIAHAERILRKSSDFKLLDDLIRIGALPQINTEYLTGFLTGRKAVKELKKGKFFLIGSDCHNNTDRPPNMLKAFSAIEKYGGKELAESLLKEHKKVLNNIIDFS